MLHYFYTEPISLCVCVYIYIKICIYYIELKNYKYFTSLIKFNYLYFINYLSGKNFEHPFLA